MLKLWGLESAYHRWAHKTKPKCSPASRQASVQIRALQPLLGQNVLVNYLFWWTLLYKRFFRFFRMNLSLKLTLPPRNLDEDMRVQTCKKWQMPFAEVFRVCENFSQINKTKKGYICLFQQIPGQFWEFWTLWKSYSEIYNKTKRGFITLWRKYLRCRSFVPNLYNKKVIFNLISKEIHFSCY